MIRFRVLFAFSVTLSLALMSTQSSRGQATSKADDDFQLTKVTEGVYGAIAKPGGVASGNAGFVIGDTGVMMIDTFFTPQAAEELIAEIAKLTNQPVKLGVNTHYHLDHTGGNQVLVSQGIPIIAHENVMQWQTVKNRRFLPAAEDLQKRRADAAKRLSEVPADQQEKRVEIEKQLRRLDAMSSIKLTNPTMSFSVGTIHYYFGKREVVLFSLPGHTGGDILAFVPDANVLFMGDMGWSRTLPNLVDATVLDWITSLDKILVQYPTARFVPGHGQVATAIEIREFRDYLVDLKTRVQRAIADGLTIEQAKQQLTLPEKYKSFAFQNFAQPNVEDMYKELKGTKFTNP
jgi:cyclase